MRISINRRLKGVEVRDTQKAPAAGDDQQPPAPDVDLTAVQADT